MKAHLLETRSCRAPKPGFSAFLFQEDIRGLKAQRDPDKFSKLPGDRKPGQKNRRSSDTQQRERKTIQKRQVFDPGHQSETGQWGPG